MTPVWQREGFGETGFWTAAAANCRAFTHSVTSGVWLKGRTHVGAKYVSLGLDGITIDV